MLLHALAEARRSGFRAMQFNFVVSTNVRAVRLWERHGFAVVGRLPGAFCHPSVGYVDAFVMYRSLLDNERETALAQDASSEVEAIELVWDYLCKRDDLTEYESSPADAILCLGSSDIRVASPAAGLMNRGLCAASTEPALPSGAA